MNRVELALKQRTQNIIAADESELLTTITYTTVATEIKKPNTKRYSQQFLSELKSSGVEYGTPNFQADQRWHFYLPAPGVIDGED